MTPFDYVTWAFVLVVALLIAWVIFRATHGFTGYRQIRNVFRVFRQMHLADNILKTARLDSEKGDVTRLIDKFRNKISVAKNFADSVRHPALVVDTTAQDGEIQAILTTGYRNQASKLIDSLHEMLDEVRTFAGEAKTYLQKAGSTDRVLAKKLEGLDLDALAGTKNPPESEQ